MVRRILFCIMLIALSLTITSPMVFSAEPAEKQELYYAISGRDIRSADPAFGTSSVELPIIYSMFDALVRYPPGNEGNMEAIEADLAEKWDTSDDGKTWTFYLRKGVKFHKGYGELTAEDVKFTFDRLKEEGAPWAKDYKNVAEIQIVDPNTVKFQLKKLDPFFLSKLTNFHGGFIVSKKARIKLGKQFKMEPVGTGPFEVGEYRPKDRYILVRNENYWRGKPILKKIIFPFMPDIASRTLAMQKGEVQMGPGKNDEKWVTVARKSNLIVDVEFQMGAASWIHMNMARKPFNDLRVRQALMYATNRDEFAQFFGATVAKPLYSHVPPGAFGALTKDDLPADLQYPYNPEKAKKLLAEAGYPKGLNIKMFLSEKGSYMTPMTVLQEQWRRVGVNIEFQTVDHPTYHSKIRKDENTLIWYNATRTPIAGVYMTQWFHSASIVGKKTAITNFSHYGEVDVNGDGSTADNSIDELVDNAATELDRDVQKKLYAEGQMRLLRDLPAVPVKLQRYVFARQKYVDLGYEPENCMIYGYHLTEKTRLLKH
jgi:peptide/nickel transport system substrate-binding protein